MATTLNTYFKKIQKNNTTTKYEQQVKVSELQVNYFGRLNSNAIPQNEINEKALNLNDGTNTERIIRETFNNIRQECTQQQTIYYTFLIDFSSYQDHSEIGYPNHFMICKTKCYLFFFKKKGNQQN